MKKSIGVIILHYKNISDTIKCLNSFCGLDITHVESKIVIVDNFSDDGSYEKLLDYIKNNNLLVDVIHTTSNLGFAKGNNFGYEFLNSHYNLDFVICSNNDIYIEDKDFYNKIVKEYEKSAFDLMGPDIFSTVENIHQNPMKSTNWTLKTIKQAIRKLKFKSFLYSCLLKTKSYKLFKFKQSIAVDSQYEYYAKKVQLNGSIIVFSSKFCKRFGYCYYPNTFLYLEEDILYYLVTHNTLISIYNPELKAFHNHSASTRNNIKSIAERKYFHIKNSIQSLLAFKELMERDADECD